MRDEDYFAIPYVLEVWAERKPDGKWVRHAEFPELPGCFVESDSLLEVIEKAENARVEYISSCLARGEKMPIPRQPLRV